MPTVDNLNIQIISNAKTAVSGIDALAAALGRLNSASKGVSGLNVISKQIGNIGTASKGISSDSATKLQQLVTALQRLSAAGNIKISSSIGTQITKIGQAVNSLGTTDFSAINRLATGLAPLAALGKSQLGSFISQLGKLPKLALELSAMDLTKFVSQIQTLATAMTPLAEKMNAISAGFAALPTKIKGVVSGLNATTTAAPKTGSALGLLNTAISGSVMKLGMLYMVFRRIKDVFGSFIKNSMEYTENLNLFNVSMGEFAQSAMDYGQKVQSVMGIDLSEWVRNQGIFMQLTTGFGIADASAASMSKTMTQLSYDLASLFNSDVETSMQKVQSGLAGELEPLRRWGYDLSVAKLQEVALSLGIDKRVISMTQADKAQLRFIAIMQQSNNAVGDMARTLITPANAMRIMSQLIERLKRALGNMLIPILTQVMPYVMAFTTVLIDAANALANLMGFMDVKIDYSNLGAGLSTASDDLDGVTSSANAASDAVKAFTLGFDQLNIVPDQTSSGSGSGSGGATDFGVDYSKYEYDFLANANTKVAEIAAKMKEALKPLSDAFGKLGTSLGPLMAQLKIFWEKYLVPFGLWVIGEGLPDLVNVIADIITWFNNNPAATIAFTTFVASCLALSKISKIAIGIKATVTGLGMLTSLLGLGGAATTTGAIEIAAGSSLVSTVGSFALAVAGLAALGITMNTFITGLSKGYDMSSKEGWTQAFAVVMGTNNGKGKDVSGLPGQSGVPGGQTISTKKDINGHIISTTASDVLANRKDAQDKKDQYQQALTNSGYVKDAASVFPIQLGGTWADKLKQIDSSGKLVVTTNAKLIATFSTLGKTVQEPTKGFNFLQAGAKTSMTGVSAAVSSSGGTISSSLKKASQDLGSFHNDTKNITQRISQTVSGNFKSAADSIGASFKGVPATLQTHMTAIRAAIESGAISSETVFTTHTKNGVDTASKLYAGLPLTVSNYLKTLSDSVYTNSDTAANALITHTKYGVDNTNPLWHELNRYATTKMQRMAENARLSIINIVDNLKLLPRNTMASSFMSAKDALVKGMLANLPLFENGGFPDRGQMFIAREAGPEMVGNIGSRSAVVNNSQIIQGITQGVAQGVAQAMGSTSKEDSGDMNFYIDGMLGFTLSAADRKNARSAHTVVTVGGS